MGVGKRWPFWRGQPNSELVLLSIVFGEGGSCHGQTDNPTDRRHHRVTSRVAPCEQQGATKNKSHFPGKQTMVHSQLKSPSCCLSPPHVSLHGLYSIHLPLAWLGPALYTDAPSPESSPPDCTDGPRCPECQKTSRRSLQCLQEQGRLSASRPHDAITRVV